MLTLIHYSCWMHFKYQVCQYLTSNHKSRVQLPTLVLLRTFVDKMAFLNGKNKQNMWNSEQDIQPSVHIWRSIKVQEQAVQVFKFNKILLTSEHPTRALNFRYMLTIDTQPASQAVTQHSSFSRNWSALPTGRASGQNVLIVRIFNRMGD